MKHLSFILVPLVAMAAACGPAHKVPAVAAADTVSEGNTSAPAPRTVPVADSIYSNHRYLYYLEYPSKQLKAGEESTNGDGKVFSDEKGMEVLRVWGGRNEDVEGHPVSLSQSYNEAIKNWTTPSQGTALAISYRKLGKDFFVLSGVKDGKILYIKTIAKQDAFAVITLQYDLKDSTAYKALTEIVSNSFRFIKDEHTGQYYPNSY